MSDQPKKETVRISLPSSAGNESKKSGKRETVRISLPPKSGAGNKPIPKSAPPAGGGNLPPKPGAQGQPNLKSPPQPEGKSTPAQPPSGGEGKPALKLPPKPGEQSGAAGPPKKAPPKLGEGKKLPPSPAKSAPPAAKAPEGAPKPPPGNLPQRPQKDAEDSEAGNKKRTAKLTSRLQTARVQLPAKKGAGQPANTGQGAAAPAQRTKSQPTVKKAPARQSAPPATASAGRSQSSQKGGDTTFTILSGAFALASLAWLVLAVLPLLS